MRRLTSGTHLVIKVERYSPTAVAGGLLGTDYELNTVARVRRHRVENQVMAHFTVNKLRGHVGSRAYTIAASAMRECTLKRSCRVDSRASEHPNRHEIFKVSFVPDLDHSARAA